MTVKPRAAGRWTDLRTRLVSAIVMITVGAAAIWLGGMVFAALVVGLTAVMVWELATMTRGAARHPWSAPLAPGIAAGGTLALALVVHGGLAVVLLVALASSMVFTPARRDRWLAGGYALAILLAGYGLVTLRHDSGAPAILWLVAVVVASDVLGYFVGRLLGGPKFWPAISPKKTWSGTVAGWIGAALVAVAFVTAGYGGWALVPLSALVAFAGQMGDIVESWVKRRAGVKDASQLIPGHGGALDRFDALIGAVVLVMLLRLIWPDVPALGG